MKNDLLYDFHTHISDVSLIKKYHDDNIVPIINCQSVEEYNLLSSYIDCLEVDALYSVGIHPNDSLKHMSIINANKNKNDNNSIDDNNYNRNNNNEKNANKNNNEKSVNKNNNGNNYNINNNHNDKNKINNKKNNNNHNDSIYKIEDNKILFIGEIGMDSVWCDIDIKVQREVFVYSLNTALEKDMAVILHTKGMEKEIYEIIKEYDLKFIIHWYGCSEYIDEYIALGCYFTVGPAIFFDEDVINLVKKAPLNRILLETDGIEALKWLYKKEISLDDVRIIMEDVLTEISKIKNTDREVVYKAIISNSERLIKNTLQIK